MFGESEITRFGLLRHATTVWNQEKRIQGQRDTPLTQFGEHQARSWGERLKEHPWDRIISSDTGRAIETASLINISFQAPLISEARLREQDWGNWTGKTLDQIKKEATQQAEAGWKFCPPGGEDRDAVCKRSQQALQAIGDRWRGETILVVTHEGVIKCLIYKLVGRQFLFSDPPILQQDHLHWLSYDGINLAVERINAIDLSSGFKVPGSKFNVLKNKGDQ